MFRRVKALIARGHQVANNADLTLTMAQALIDDIQDGVEVRVQVSDNAAGQIARLVLGSGGEFPLSVTLDPEWDRNPGDQSRFRGGPYDGRVYKIPREDVNDGEIVLKGGHVYRWTGKEFAFVHTSER